MKRILFIVWIAFASVGLMAFQMVRKYTEIFKQLGIEATDAKASIDISFQDGVLDVPYSKMIVKLAIGKREAAVREIGDFIKAYTESAEFAEKYKEAREAAKPQGMASPEEKIRERIEQVEHDIETTETDMKKTSGDMRKLYEATLLELKKERKALSNPADPLHNFYVKNATEVKEWESQMVNEDVKAWQDEYPATVKELVRRRLTKFLAFTKDIDFNAQLVKRGNKMVFADPELEAKDDMWKRCFRCGKETITAARQYAQQWLAAIK